MKIYFLRHGKADWPDWDGADNERPLTHKGRKEMKRVAKFVAALEPKISIVLTSPLPRARQTAEIAAHHLNLKCKTEPALGRGFNVPKLRKIIEQAKGANLMLVGHEPSFSAVIRELTEAKVKLAKAGIALLDMPKGSDEAELVWLLPPKISRR